MFYSKCATSLCVAGTGHFMPLFWDTALLLGKRDSLSPLNHWVFLLCSLFSFHFFIIRVRFVFIAACLSLDWSDLLSEIIQCPITNVMDASSLTVTPQRGKAQRDKCPFQKGPADVPQHTLLVSLFFSKEEMLRRSWQQRQRLLICGQIGLWLTGWYLGLLS